MIRLSFPAPLPNVQSGMNMQTSVKDDFVYVTDKMPGITRRPYDDGCNYFGSENNLIHDKYVVGRIESLAIPPAYKNVWICPLYNGLIQATGFDEAGRKQYRYHASWREYRDCEK
jgi:DNA topoisomerase-1